MRNYRMTHAVCTGFFLGLLCCLLLAAPVWAYAGVKQHQRAHQHLPAQLTRLTKVDCQSHAGAVDLVLYFQHWRAKAIHTQRLHHPERHVVDLYNTVPQRGLKWPKRCAPYVTQIRWAQHVGHRLRVVLTLARTTQVAQAWVARPQGKMAWRFRIRSAAPSKLIHTAAKPKLHTVSTNKGQQKDRSAPHTAHSHLPTPRPKHVVKSGVHASSPPKIKYAPIVVVIDPGHGGKDPGAIGIHGVQEKQVVLAISKQLAAALNRHPGFKAYLTRQRDQFIPLRQRMRIARHDKADLLIAIHADAYRHPQAKGASIYVLSQRGATSEAARWLAERGNHSELLHGGRVWRDAGQMLRALLLSLQERSTIRESLQIGQTLLNRLAHQVPLHHSKVEQAAFVVLKSPDIPSILVETGFISNKQDAQRLRQPAAQQRLVRALTAGIVDHYRRYPLQRSIFGLI